MRVLQALQEALTSGRLTPGEKYPSINQLAEEHGVATVTARRALEKLRDEGRAEPQQGVGWFVTEPTIEDLTVEERIQQLCDRLEQVEGELDELKKQVGSSA